MTAPHAFRHLYVHVPFCARRCAYCDFAIAVRSRVPVGDYVHGIDRELRLRARAWTQRPEVDTLYLGGGTPSRLGAEGVAALLDVIRGHVAVADGGEVTLEANPEDVTVDAVGAWRRAGVNRLSLGVQSFQETVLRWMHRTHDAGAIRRAAGALRTAGIDDWSLDLIYALPPSVPRDWEADLDAALALAPPHLSAYGLTVEPGTPLGRWRERGVVREAPEEAHEREFLTAHRRLAEAGYEHYEVSNWAAPGRQSRHNRSYWRGVAYEGVGPGAHSFDGHARRWNVREYVPWLGRVRAGEDPVDGSERLDAAAHALEAAYVGLRTRAGLPVEVRDLPIVTPWIDAGWGEIEGERLRLTPMGWLRLDALVLDLTERRSRF